MSQNAQLAQEIQEAIKLALAPADSEVPPCPPFAVPEDPAQLAKYVDHTILKPAASIADVKKICAEGREFGFASICVNSCHAGLVKSELGDCGVKTCCVVGFPLGAMGTVSKAAETRQAVADGADEIDMVVNVGWLKSGELEAVLADITAVVQAAGGKTVKVIIETILLTDEEKVAACYLSKKAGAHFVKTSTGFSGGGATVEDVALMRRVVGQDLEVKASGGIRDREAAEAMISAGADRLGCSAGVAIVSGGKGKENY
jgi:deoxyribose-phosphate aldolase